MNYLSYPHHPKVEKLVNILRERTNNSDTSMVTIMACYHLAKLASMMHCKVDARGMGTLPVNFYGFSLASSGLGKGHSMSIIEEHVIKPFMIAFTEQTRPYITEVKLTEMANQNALRNGTDPNEELESIKGEYNRIGAFYTSFSEGTGPAIKEYRHQILMTEIGSMNFEIDEIGNNLIGLKEVTDTFLELWDGTIKAKLTKNTAENKRLTQISGKSPTNMLGFGTPTAIFDGGVTEKTFLQNLTSGYARRSFFGYSELEEGTPLTSEERLKRLMDTSSDDELFDLSLELEKLANPAMHKFVVKMPESVLAEVVEYQMHCEERMRELRKSDDIMRAELRGRHFKTIKFAGALAFLDCAPEMTSAHWRAAVRVAEESGIAFKNMLSQDPAHARLAKFLADHREPATMADLVQELPFFPKTASNQRDLIKLAIAWGSANNIIIKKRIHDDIETIQGEALVETDMDKLMCSISDHVAYNYFNTEGTLKELAKTVVAPNTHWCNHRFVDGHRTLANTIQGFNLIVLDVDGTCKLETAKSILADHEYLIYTTKSHTPDSHRFRIVLPMSHTLKLPVHDYKEFMDNVLEELPFEVDPGVKEANKKWLANPGAEVVLNKGKLFNVVSFIPKSKKNEERKKQAISMENMGGLERFFLNEANEGNRNNTLIRYAYALLDAGYDLEALKDKVRSLNANIQMPLEEDELESTVIKSATNRYLTRG